MTIGLKGECLEPLESPWRRGVDETSFVQFQVTVYKILNFKEFMFSQNYRNYNNRK